MIILSLLADYRVDFFEKLNESLEKQYQKLVVVHGNNISDKVIKESTGTTNFIIEQTTSTKKTFWGYNLNWQKGLFAILKKHNPHKVIILYNAGNINYNLLLLYLKITQIPYILWGCGWERSNLRGIKFKIKNLFKSFFIKMSTGYITYDSSFSKKLISDGYPQKKIIVAQNTLNIEKIIKYRTPQNRTYDVIKFLFVGALVKEKLLTNAIKAFNNIKEIGEKFSFIIIGEGVQKNLLDTLVKQYKLENEIKIVGAKYGKELSNYFENSNVFILPGAGGLAINEAMAYSLPIISTPADGTVYDLVDNGVNGFIIEHNYSIKELENRILFFIKSDKNRIIKMEKESLRLIQERASLQNQVNKFIKAINEF